MSHFEATADTDDLATSPLSCENLARRDPSQAIRNADTYQLFGENWPYVPLRPGE